MNKIKLYYGKDWKDAKSKPPVECERGEVDNYRKNYQYICVEHEENDTYPLCYKDPMIYYKDEEICLRGDNWFEVEVERIAEYILADRVWENPKYSEITKDLDDEQYYQFIYDNIDELMEIEEYYNKALDFWEDYAIEFFEEEYYEENHY